MTDNEKSVKTVINYKCKIVNPYSLLKLFKFYIIWFFLRVCRIKKKSILILISCYTFYKYICILSNFIWYYFLHYTFAQNTLILYSSWVFKKVDDATFFSIYQKFYNKIVLLKTNGHHMGVDYSMKPRYIQLSSITILKLLWLALRVITDR